MKNNKQTQKNFILIGADGGTVYTLAVAVPLLVSLIFSIILIATGLSTNQEFLNSSFYTYLSFALSSISLFLVTVYAVKKHNLDFKQTVGIEKCDKKYYLIAILLAFGCLFGVGWLNDAFITLLQKLGLQIAEITLPKNHFGDYILCVVIVCLLPAFFEEVIFRGFVLNGARKGGDIFAIVCCGLLFSLFHKNPAQTVYQFILGMVFVLLTLKSGSVLPAMLFHFINNFYVVTYYFLAPDGYQFDKIVQIILCVLAVTSFVLATLYLIFKCEKPQLKKACDNDFAKIISQKESAKTFSLFALPGVVACVFVWIISLL